MANVAIVFCLSRATRDFGLMCYLHALEHRFRVSTVTKSAQQLPWTSSSLYVSAFSGLKHAPYRFRKTKLIMKLGKKWDEPHCYFVMHLLAARVLRSGLLVREGAEQVVDAAAAAHELVFLFNNKEKKCFFTGPAKVKRFLAAELEEFRGGADALEWIFALEHAVTWRYLLQVEGMQRPVSGFARVADSFGCLLAFRAGGATDAQWHQGIAEL